MPNRILKESICTSDNLNELKWFDECFFYRLLVNCDDYGRMDARPPILKARLFPLKDVTNDAMEKALNALRAAGLIDLYEVSGRPILQLRTWERHQQIRAKKSKYPAKTASDSTCNQMISNDIKCPRNPIQSESESESEGVNACARKETTAPLPFGLTDAEIDASLTRDQQIEQAARDAGLPFFPANILTARDLANEYGMEWLLEAIRRAADGKSQTWGYVKGILRSWKERGGMDAENKAKTGGKRVSAQAYTQREYTDAELNAGTLELLKEAMELG